MTKILSNVQAVVHRVEAACRRVGRSADEVTIIGVTKYVGVPEIEELLAAGISHLGENRVQEAAEKFPQLAGWDFTSHMIGHLQRNKVKRCLDLFEFIHSLDSLRLAREIDKQSRKRGRVMPCLVQVNVSGEESKYGFSPDEVREVFPKLVELEYIELRGLMTMAPLVKDPEDARPCFRRLRQLAEELQSQYPSVCLSELSMGMSNDFEVAVEEGATMVRIGSAFFH